jgi:hypothetical protein
VSWGFPSPPEAGHEAPPYGILRQESRYRVTRMAVIARRSPGSSSTT